MTCHIETSIVCKAKVDTESWGNKRNWNTEKRTWQLQISKGASSSRILSSSTWNHWYANPLLRMRSIELCVFTSASDISIMPRTCVLKKIPKLFEELISFIPQNSPHIINGRESWTSYDVGDGLRHHYNASDNLQSVT